MSRCLRKRLRFNLALILIVAFEFAWMPQRGIGGDEVLPLEKTDPFVAAERGDLEAVKTAVENHPEILKISKAGGWTLLHYAAHGNQPKVIRYLVQKGMDVNDRGDNNAYVPLHSAAESADGALEAAKTLIELGADPSAREGDPDVPAEKSRGLSVLEIAASRGHLGMVKLLLEKDVPLGLKARRNGREVDKWMLTALHMASRGKVASKYQKDPETAGNQKVIDLLAQRIDINTRLSGGGQTPLYMAASEGAVETVRHLLENYPQIKINATSGSIVGNTPLHAAIHTPGIKLEDERRIAIIKLLVQHGADTDLRNDLRNEPGMTPLQWARRHGSPAVVKALEEAIAARQVKEGARGE